MAKRKASKRQRYLDQAQAAAIVRYQPELRGLMELMRQADSDYRTSVHQAAAGAAGTQAAVAQARPQLEAIYNANEATRRQISAVPAASLAALGPAADAFRVAQQQEMGGALASLSTTKTQALGDLVSRGVRASESAASSRRSAASQRASDRAKISRQIQGVLQEQGVFTAAEAGKLSEAAADRALRVRLERAGNAQSERNSVRSSGVDPDTGLPIPGGKLDPKAQKKGKRLTASGGTALTRDKHLEWQTGIGEIANYARKYKGKLSRQAIVGKLAKGRPQQRITVDPDTGEKLRNPVTLTKIPAFKPDLRMTAALDVALDGHLSRETQRKLVKAGFILSELGLPTYGAYARKRKPPSSGQIVGISNTLKNIGV